MIYCPKCGAQNYESQRTCIRCSAPLPDLSTRQGPHSGYQSVYQQPGMGYQNPPQQSAQGAGGYESYQPPSYPVPAPYPMAPLIGQDRSIALSVVLSIITCGIYLLIWQYMIGKEIRDYLQRDEPRPGLDILLAILTCGLWLIYVAYKYPSLIADMQVMRRLPKSDLAIASILLTIFGFHVISVALWQSELNKFWEISRLQP